MHGIRIAVLLTLAASAASAQSFDGTYALDGGRCTDGGDQVPFTIAGDQIRFYESVCQLTNPREAPSVPGAYVFDGVCQGEGETWTTPLVLAPAPNGGLFKSNDGRDWSTHARC